MKEGSSKAEDNRNQIPVPKHEPRSLYNSEKKRYEEKGFGFIVALLTTLGFFFCAPKICREWFWPLCL